MSTEPGHSLGSTGPLAVRRLRPQEKERVKKEREALEAKFKVAYVDGQPEPVGG